MKRQNSKNKYRWLMVLHGGPSWTLVAGVDDWCRPYSAHPDRSTALTYWKG